MSKEALIILPGWQSNKHKWHVFCEIAKEDFDVHVIELPCFGDEPCPADVWGVEDYATFVKEKIEQLDITQPKIILGHSFGGAVATQLVAMHPTIFDELMLVGAAIVRPKITLKRTTFGLIAKIGKYIFRIPLLKKHQAIAKKFLYKAADSPDYDKTHGMVRSIYQKIIRQDLCHLLPEITVPTTLIWGARDSYTPLKYGKKIHSLIQGSTLHIMKEGTHGLHHDPYVKEFYSLVVQSV